MILVLARTHTLERLKGKGQMYGNGGVFTNCRQRESYQILENQTKLSKMKLLLMSIPLAQMDTPDSNWSECSQTGVIVIYKTAHRSKFLQDIKGLK